MNMQFNIAGSLAQAYTHLLSAEHERDNAWAALDRHLTGTSGYYSAQSRSFGCTANYERARDRARAMVIEKADGLSIDELRDLLEKLS